MIHYIFTNKILLRNGQVLGVSWFILENDSQNRSYISSIWAKYSILFFQLIFHILKLSYFSKIYVVCCIHTMHTSYSHNCILYCPCYLIEVEDNFTKDFDIYSTSYKYVFECPKTYYLNKKKKLKKITKDNRFEPTTSHTYILSHSI